MTDGEREELLKELYKPFDKALIKTRQGGGGKTFEYVDTYKVIARLNEATLNTWSSEIVRMEFQPWGGNMLAVATVRLMIEGLGHRDGVGVQVLVEGKAEDLVKGAQSDALKNAAAKFGVALALYGADPVLSEEERATIAQKATVNGMPNVIHRPDREGLKQERAKGGLANANQGSIIYAKWMDIYGDKDGLREWVSSMCDGIGDTRKISYEQADELIRLLKQEESRKPQEAWS